MNMKRAVVPAVKDYYEILGIRPNSRLPEIELAFKGRRTQYHPDKYTGADTETIRWATEKMQEVNEAYTALSNAETRVHYDQNRQYASGKNADSRGASSSGTAKTKNGEIDDAPFILDYLMAMSLSQKDAKRFHFAPDVPRQKLNNAVSSRGIFATSLPSQVYLLVDDTVFGGGADGLLITDEVISFKEAFLNSNDYVYTKGWNGGFHLEGSSIKRHDETCKTFSLISAAATHMVVDALNQFCADHFQWHREMAQRGHVASQFILSASCHGKPEEELHWLTLAAENGHVVAQHNLGVHYLNKHPRLAFEWLTKAAQQGSKLAEERLRAANFKQFH
jgi:curved DNA-binding protein